MALTNDDIALMLGAKPKNKYNNGPKIIDMVETKKLKSFDTSDIKFTPESTKGVGDNLKNVPPLIIIGIALIVAAGFTPYKWLFTLGFCVIILAVFDKVIPAEKKKEIADKFKGWLKKK